MVALAALQPTGRPQMTRREVFDAVEPYIAGLVRRMVARAPHLRPDEDDLAQEARVILWHIAADYDPARSSPRTYALSLVRLRLIDKLRSRRRDSGISDRAAITRAAAGKAVPVCLSYDATISPTAEHHEAGGLPMRMLAGFGKRDAEVTDGPRAEFVAVLRRTGAMLVAEERAALADYFAEGRSMKEIGDRRGVNESMASRIINRALGIIREQLAADGRTCLN